MPKYYFTQMAARPVVLSGRSYRFLICSQMSGRSVGVYETQSDEEIQIFDQGVRERRGISEISQGDYEELKKKATKTLQSPKSGGFKPKLARLPIVNPPLKMDDRAGAPGVASAKRSDAEESMLTAPEAASLIRIEKVSSPKPFSGSENKIVRASKRANAAKIRSVRPAVDTAPV